MQGSTKPLKSESNNIRDELAVVLGSEAFFQIQAKQRATELSG